MVIEFTARHFRAPDNLRAYAEKELQRLTKVHDRITQCQIILHQEKTQFVAELNLSIPQRKLNVKESTDNVTKSIDRAVDKMVARLTRLKKKRIPF
jgi:ribosomal subunit interface protein